MSNRRPYIRPMAGWWRKNPFFIEYMIHEGTALFVAAYAFILLTSVVKLAEGKVAWEQWVLCLTDPLAIGIHVVLLVAFLYHTWTWFNIMPRTLPPILVGGKPVSAPTITAIGLAAAFAASMALFIICRSIAP